jgi:hypothetical protein
MHIPTPAPTPTASLEDLVRCTLGIYLPNKKIIIYIKIPKSFAFTSAVHPRKIEYSDLVNKIPLK